MENLFDFVPGSANENDSAEAESATRTHHVTAYQLIRVVKSAGGFYFRTIIDTIKIERSIEHARDRAISKARMIGDCMVIELSEKLVSTFEKGDRD